MISYGQQTIDDDDIAAVVDVLKGKYLTTGPKVRAFEEGLASLTGAKHVIACANATTALHLATIALGIGPGDAVIVPSITFLATANSVRFAGADIIFSDVDPNTGLMSKTHLQDAFSRRGSLNVKAVYPVHLTGQCVDLAALKSVADEHNIKIVADSCHAIGGHVNGYPVGACQYEDISTFSFHPVKTIACGEGGCLITNHDVIAATARKARSHGMESEPDAGPWAYTMRELGYNYRITDIQCALGLSQLKKLPRFANRRRELVAKYNELLNNIPHLETIKTLPYGDAVRHLFSVLIDFDAAGVSRAEIMTRLKNKGIGTQVHYIPVHTQPYYTRLYGQQRLAGAEAYYSRTLSLPLYPNLTDQNLQHIAQSLRELLGV